MSPVPLPTRVFLACGVTDMRKGFDGLAVLVQQALAQNPHSGALFAFRGKRGQPPTFRIQFAIRDDRISVAPAVGTNLAGLALSAGPRAEMHLH